MGYTSKYAHDQMQKATSNHDKDPKKEKRLQSNKSGGSGQATKKQDKRYKKDVKHNENVDKRRSKDIKKGKTKNLSKKSRTYRI